MAYWFIILFFMNVPHFFVRRVYPGKGATVSAELTPEVSAEPRPNICGELLSED